MDKKITESNYKSELVQIIETLSADLPLYAFTIGLTRENKLSVSLMGTELTRDMKQEYGEEYAKMEKLLFLLLRRAAKLFYVNTGKITRKGEK